jgi:hypothetical protein
MALNDDLNKLAAQDVVYLTRTLGDSNQPTEVFRGRLRQALNGDWVFNASTGQNGMVGFVLGNANSSWTSSESPAAGMQVTMPFEVMLPTPLGGGGLSEVIVVTTVIPSDFTD